MLAGNPWLSRTFRSTLGAALIAIVGAVALVVIALVQERENCIEAATIQAENTSRLMAGYVLQSIQKVDMVMRDMQEHVQPADMAARRGQNPRRTEELHRILAKKLAAIAEGSVLHLTNADGDHIYSSLAVVPGINIADRYHFLRQKENPAAGLVISPPLISRTTGKWAFVLSRRLNFEDGRFAGIVNLVVNLEGLEKFFSSLDVGHFGAVGLRDREMRLMARFPALKEAIGKPAPDHPAQAFLRQGLDHGVYHSAGLIDGVRGLFSFRQVGDLGLYVVAGVAEEDYLSDWRMHIKIYGLASLALVATVLLMLYRAWRGMIERERALASLAESEKELKRSNAELEQFAYAVSHDMRQPLRMVSAYLQLMEQALSGKLDAETQEFLAFALDGAKRMDQMILSLLDYSRVGRKTEPKGWLESRSAMDEAHDFLSPEIASSQASVEVRGDWPGIWASRDEMVRLLQNLLGNALKYHEENEAPHVEVVSVVAHDRWRVEVRDHGVGIDPSQAERLFKVFSRLQSRARFEGSGVGLALCRRIVEHHGGVIGVSSDGEGKGCTFWFELPIGHRSEEAGEPPAC